MACPHAELMGNVVLWHRCRATGLTCAWLEPGSDPCPIARLVEKVEVLMTALRLSCTWDFYGLDGSTARLVALVREAGADNSVDRVTTARLEAALTEVLAAREQETR